MRASKSGQVKEETAWDRANTMRPKAKTDKATCDKLFAIMEAAGEAGTYVDMLTNTAYYVRAMAYDDDLVLKEATRRKMKMIRDDLGWEAASALERLLIDRISVCWHTLHRAEQRHITALETAAALETQAFYDKQVDRAHRRYQQAIQSLAVVRRLQIPALQINQMNADKQINVFAAGVQGAEGDRGDCFLATLSAGLSLPDLTGNQ